MTYQEQLTERRRAAMHTQLYRMRHSPALPEWNFQGKRPDQVAFSAFVLVGVMVLGLLTGLTAAILGAL